MLKTHLEIDGFCDFFRFSGDISEQAKFQTYPDNYDTLSLSNFMIVYRFYVQNIIFHVSGTPVSFAPRIQSIHWAAGLQFK